MADDRHSTGTRIGIEISNLGLTAVVLADTGEVAASETVSFDGAEGASDKLISLVQKLERDHQGIEHIGIAVPGLVDRRTGRIAYSANIPRHSQFDLAADLKAATGLDVVVENDANAAAYGEFQLGAGRDCRNIFYVTLGEGIGAAFILGGRVWRGASGFAGEFGYVPINSEGQRLEEVASSANILRRTRERIHQDSTSTLGSLTPEAIRLSDIVAAAEANDDFSQMMLERTGTYVGTAIASVINLLSPERIVVGGEIMQARSIVLEAITGRARELSFEPSFAAATIVEGELGPNAPAIGAALIAGAAGNE